MHSEHKLVLLLRDALRRIQELATDNKPCDEFYALAAIVKECENALETAA